MLASFFLLPFSFPLALSGPKEVVEQKEKKKKKWSQEPSQEILVACFIFFLVLCLDPLENRE